jgi:hypothetical protein
MCVHICAMKFESLQVLNISRTDAGDNCLQILGMYCTNLRYKNVFNRFFVLDIYLWSVITVTYFIRELNVSGCYKITDAGIQGLCVSVNHLGKEYPRLGQCKSIETLIIGGTQITKKGVPTAFINFLSWRNVKLIIAISSQCHF